MANYTQLIQTINDNIKANGNQEITGPVLNAVLQAIVNGLSEGALFAGIATTTTNPGTPDGNVFYLAIEPGTYSNFGVIVPNGSIGIISNTSSDWAVKLINTYYEIDVDTLMQDSPSSDDIDEAIGSFTYLKRAITVGVPFFGRGASGGKSTVAIAQVKQLAENEVRVVMLNTGTVDGSNELVPIIKKITNSAGQLSLSTEAPTSFIGPLSSLNTNEKGSVVRAINEVNTVLKSVVKPYVVNLTDLLAAKDSESISTAIGGIDNLTGTVQKNQVIFGTLANGTVAVGIRVLGNKTTLTYFVDSVLGLTVNEIIITNTSGTLTKTANTHAVITENMVVDSLTSDETTLPLSAAQGKALNEKILNSDKVYVIDGSILYTEDNPTSEQISEAIGGWDNLSNAIRNNNIILLQQVQSGASQLNVAVVAMVSDSDTTIQLSFMAGAALVLLFTKELDAISLRKSLSDFITSQDITSAINALDSSGQTASTGEVISSISQENGVISVSKKTLTSDDIPELPQSKITNLEAALAGKQDTLKAGTGIEITPENQINVTLDTTVFKVVSVLPDSPAAGDENKIHLVPAESTEEGNIYTEYVFVNGKWEEFGTYRSEVDLTPYLKKVDAEATYQKITDDTLATTAKTIVGAINEINEKINNVLPQVAAITAATKSYEVTDITDAENV